VTFPLEVWLSGTPAELDAAVAALTDAGRVSHTSPRTPLPGDPGRHRLYLRVHVAATPAAAPRRAHRSTRGRLPVAGEGWSR